MTKCADCGKTVAADTGDVENYIVHDHVWAEAGMKSFRGGCLCVSCIESRLGRPLTGDDLPLGDVLVNYPGQQRDTPRMHQLKSDAVAAAGYPVSPWEERRAAVLTKLLAMAATREAL